jgi:hypothetical protein
MPLIHGCTTTKLTGKQAGGLIFRVKRFVERSRYAAEK